MGPSSTRVILEVLETGTSQIVEQAVKAIGRDAAIERSRAWRANFLTRSQVIAALREPAPGAVSLEQYRGDLQMHSVWSDGSQTLEAIVTSVLARGYEYCAVTDHSYGLPIARGMSMSAMAQQHAEIDRLNERYRGRFRLIKGIEANIGADGALDMTANELRQLELVVAAPHAALRVTTDQTARMLRTVRTPGVHILGHPRGRKYGSRPGVSAWAHVFREAGVIKSRSKSTETPRVRTSITSSRGWQSTQAVCSRSTATRTAPPTSSLRKPRLHTHGWRAFRPRAWLTRGRSNGCWSGPAGSPASACCSAARFPRG